MEQYITCQMQTMEEVQMVQRAMENTNQSPYITDRPMHYAQRPPTGGSKDPLAASWIYFDPSVKMFNISSGYRICPEAEITTQLSPVDFIRILELIRTIK